MIIHGFALLHAGVALACRLAGVGDELFLTILTMAMLLAICYKKKLSIEFTAALTIAGNILGYLMGTVGATILEHFFTSPLLIHALSTAIRQAPQASSAFRTPTAVSLQSWDRRVRPRLV